jgi:hypothetical protein
LTLRVDLAGHWTDDGYQSHSQQHGLAFHFVH